MGFDYVNYKTDCPVCGNEVNDFQTKDTGCWFEKIEYWQCDNFYASCEYCNTWIEFKLNRSKVSIPIEAYEIRIELSSKDETQFIRNAEGKIVGIKGNVKS